MPDVRPGPPDAAPAAPRRRFAGILSGRSPVRHGLVLAADAVVAVLSLLAAYLLRFEGAIPAEYRGDLAAAILCIAVARPAASLALRLHRWSFRSSGLTDALRVVVAGAAGTALFLSLVFLFRLRAVPRGVVVMELLLTTVCIGAMRFGPRVWWTFAAAREREGDGTSRPTIIVGAAAAGEMLLRDLQRSRDHDLRVVGFLDDDRQKWGLIIHGVPVLGDLKSLPDCARRYGVRNVLLTIRSLPARRLRELLSLSASLKVTFKILPVSYAYLRERVSASMLQSLSPEDLLPREPIVLAGVAGDTSILGRTALVTGAAGSIGSEICAQLLASGIARLVMVDMDENGLYLLARRFERKRPGGDVAVEVADIRDAARMDALFAKYRPQDVFHAAAHKHVPLMETAPCEAIKNNVLGTRHVAAAAHAHGAARFVYISTDKAVRPTSVMGASKHIGEHVVRAFARRSLTRFTAVRFGNVLGSAGSVVPIFREQIAAGGPVTVTHPEVRRYFMTVSEAVGLVLRAAYADHGELCVLDMGEQLRIDDLARHMITMSGLAPDHDVRIVYTGLRPGEKLYEELSCEREEKARRVADRILVVEGPEPPHELDAALDGLAEACAREDVEDVMRLVSALVPSFVRRQAVSAGR